MLEIVLAFMAHTETIKMSNDFQEYWSEIWTPITQNCLNVAKQQFVLQKAFEMFRVNRLTRSVRNLTWSEVFVHETEKKILTSLCNHVKLSISEFMFHGLNQHRNRCRKYYSTSTKQTVEVAFCPTVSSNNRQQPATTGNNCI